MVQGRKRVELSLTEKKYLYPMKEIRRGYRLTTEEESILQRDKSGTEERDARDNGPEISDSDPEPKNNRKRPRALQAILPLLGVFVLMIGIAYFFFYLVSGKHQPPQDEASVRVPELVIPERQKAVFIEELGLSAEESAAFWPVYVRFCTEIEEVGRQHLEWLAKQEKENPSDLSLEEFMNSYTTDYKQFSKTILRYSEAFSALLGEDRVPSVFLLYEEWQGRKSSVNP